ncbi:MAG: hypothetical protein HKL99_10650 [Burkholderiales bacterium]|nr:hypothetical protein [Burkholderiales bacterium]
MNTMMSATPPRSENAPAPWRDVWRWVDAALGAASLAWAIWQYRHATAAGWIALNAVWSALLLVSAALGWSSRILAWTRRRSRIVALAFSLH